MFTYNPAKLLATVINVAMFPTRNTRSISSAMRRELKKKINLQFHDVSGNRTNTDNVANTINEIHAWLLKRISYV